MPVSFHEKFLSLVCLITLTFTGKLEKDAENKSSRLPNLLTLSDTKLTVSKFLHSPVVLINFGSGIVNVIVATSYITAFVFHNIGVNSFGFSGSSSAKRSLPYMTKLFGFSFASLNITVSSELCFN